MGWQYHRCIMHSHNRRVHSATAAKVLEIHSRSNLTQTGTFKLWSLISIYQLVYVWQLLLTKGLSDDYYHGQKNWTTSLLKIFRFQWNCGYAIVENVVLSNLLYNEHKHLSGTVFSTVDKKNNIFLFAWNSEK